MLCDTSGVGERCGVLSTGSPFGHHPRLRIVCPRWGQWGRDGRFLYSLPLHLSTSSPFGHHPRLRMVCPRWGQWVQAGRFLFSLPLHSPRVHPSGITRGYAWCVPSGDSGCACEDVHLQSSFTEFIKSLYIVCGTAFFLPRGCLNVSKNVGCGCRKGGAARVNTVFI